MAQLVTNDLNTKTAAQLAALLVGPTITVSNAQFTGVKTAAGSFTGGAGIVGFASGVVLSSGNISLAKGPNYDTDAGANNGQAGDAALTIAAGLPTFDAACLEFDFVPTGDNITLQYVFSSEEYNEYVEGNYNDVFGFYVNGTNIALIPGTTTPAAVKSVNLYASPEYYLDNDFQDGTAPYNTQMDGLTVVLSAQGAVNPNHTNHLRLVIADAGDGILDSNVFLKAISITANHLPVAVADSYNGDQTISVDAPGLLKNDSDADADALTAIKVSDPLHGTVTVNADGSFSYVAVGNYLGEDAFTYKANDGKADSAITKVTLNIISTNAEDDTPPAILEDAPSTPIDVLANDTDLQNDALTVTAVTQGGKGAVLIAVDSKSVIYTPNSNENGSDAFTYTISDGNGHSDSATVYLTITAVNDAPTLDAGKSPVLDSINEDAGAPTGPVGTLVSSLVDFASPAGQVDNVTDADTGAVLGIAVTGAATTHGSWFYSTDNGANWTGLDTVSDTQARLLAADASTRLYFQPSSNYSGTVAAAITFRAWDRSSGVNGTLVSTSLNGLTTAFSTASDSASIVVNAQTDAPTSAAPSTVSGTEDTTLAFTGDNGLSVSDGDGDDLKVTLTATQGTLSMTTLAGLDFTTGDGTADTTMTFSGSQSNLNAALATLSFNPSADYNGNATLAFTTTDDNVAAPVVKNIAIALNAVADAVTDSVTPAEDTAITFNALTGTNGASADNFEGTPSVTGVTQGAHGTVAFLANGALTYTPAADYDAGDSFTYTVTSGGVTEIGTVNVTVNPNNDNPTLTVANSTVTVNEGATASNSGSYNDVDSTTVTLSASEGTVTKTGTNSGNWSWSKATVDNEAAHTVTITANDGDKTGTTTFSLTVNNVDPTATNNSYTTDSGGVASGNVITDTPADSDPAGSNDPLTVSTHTNPANGTLNIAADGSFTYTHDNGTTGSDSFTYTISDGDGGTATATASITVAGSTQRNGVFFTVTPTYNGERATLVYKLRNETNASLTAITVKGNLDRPVSGMVASRGSTVTKVVNPRSNAITVTWSGFELGAGREATLTIQILSAPPKSSISSAWAASWKSNNKSASASVNPVARP